MGALVKADHAPFGSCLLLRSARLLGEFGGALWTEFAIERAYGGQFCQLWESSVDLSVESSPKPGHSRISQAKTA
eukprot:2974601-Rhodomonas_salina.1